MHDGVQAGRQGGRRARRAAVALLNGEEPETNGTINNERWPHIPYVLLDPVAIFQDDVKDVVDDGFVTRRRRVHRDFDDLCAEAGVVRSPARRHRRWSRAADTRRPGRQPRHRAPLASPRDNEIHGPSTPTRSSPETPSPCSSCAASTRASAPCTSCTTSTSQVYPGQVTALVGDNGAGKSTLVKCIAGIYGIDSGEILFEGRPVTLHGPEDAAALGIEVVYQDLALCDNLDIVQNMFLGRETPSRDRLDEAPMERRARETLASLSVRTVKSRAPARRRACPVASARRWRSPRPCCGTPRS